MLILSRVCAEFHNTKGEKIFAVTPAARNIFIEAPDAVREDPLFRMLMNDGSLEAAVPEERQKILENDPTAGHDASGKTIPPAPDGPDGPVVEAKAEEKPAAKAGRPAKAGKA